MGYFDGLVDASFKKDSQDRDLFYPYGVLGSGIILKSPEQKNQIRKTIKTSYMVIMPIIFAVQIFIGILANLVILVMYYVWFYLYIKKTTKDLERSAEKLKTSDAYKNSAKSHNLATLMILTITSLLFVVAGIFLLATGANLIISLVTIVFFGLCSLAIDYMLIFKFKNRTNQINK